MKFHLHFDQKLQKSTLHIQPIVQLSRFFPFSKLNRYYHNSPSVLIRQLHYSRKSIQIDHYKTKHATPYSLEISVNAPAYVLIILHHGKLYYYNPQNTHEKVCLKSKQCILLQVKPGRYFARLGHRENNFHILSLSPEILYPLREEFHELITFMDKSMPSAKLLSMQSHEMDQSFISRLSYILNYSKKNYKDFNRHLIWQLPKLLSAYKGLLKQRDRPSQEKQLFIAIQKHIDKHLKSHCSIHLKDILKTYPISKNKLNEIFLKYQQATPGLYIMHRKITLIAKELKSSPASILSIALKFGYSDTNAMTKSFKKIMGTTPSNYRKS